MIDVVRELGYAVKLAEQLGKQDWSEVGRRRTTLGLLVF
jgi:hypothetical protein